MVAIEPQIWITKIHLVKKSRPLQVQKQLKLLLK